VKESLESRPNSTSRSYAASSCGCSSGGWCAPRAPGAPVRGIPRNPQ
jgi:hypothetical protein